MMFRVLGFRVLGCGDTWGGHPRGRRPILENDMQSSGNFVNGYGMSKLLPSNIHYYIALVLGKMPT